MSSTTNSTTNEPTSYSPSSASMRWRNARSAPSARANVEGTNCSGIDDRPWLLPLDEPAAGLDLAGRETLVKTLGELAQDHYAPASVLVTHHVEEIPTGITHAMLLKDGKIVAAGPLRDTLTF